MVVYTCSLCNRQCNTRNMYRKHVQREHHRRRVWLAMLEECAEEVGYWFLLFLALGLLLLFVLLIMSTSRPSDSSRLRVPYEPDKLGSIFDLPMLEDQTDDGHILEVDPEEVGGISATEFMIDDEFQYSTDFDPDFDLPPPDFEPNSQVIVYLGGQKNPDIDEEL